MTDQLIFCLRIGGYDGHRQTVKNDVFYCLTGKTALHWAAAVNNVDGIRLLLHSNANKDIQDQKV